MNFIYEVGSLTSPEYINLLKSVGWKLGSNLNLDSVDVALQNTSYTIVVRSSKGEAIAAGRVFSDDLTMTFIPDILVKPEYQRQGHGKKIVEMIKSRFGHTIFFFGSQQESFFEKLDFKKAMPSFTGRFSANSFFD
jgi:N-acetylglutamate synthase-like GNAT family acetyltransferase